MIEIPVIKQRSELSDYLHVLLEDLCALIEAAFVQSGNTRSMTRLARKDWFHLQGTALQQCAREARVLEDNSRVLFKYSKATCIILLTMAWLVP